MTAITIKVSPNERGKGNEYRLSAKVREIPEEILDAVKMGIEGSFSSGIKFGYETTDVIADVQDIEYDELTGPPFAFTSCAAIAFDKACQEAGAVLMEPIMKVQVVSPGEYIGDVISSITQRNGIVESMESKTGGDIVTAQVPLEKMFGYSTILRSATQGRGSFSMEFSHYQEKA